MVQCHAERGVKKKKSRPIHGSISVYGLASQVAKAPNATISQFLRGTDYDHRQIFPNFDMDPLNVAIANLSLPDDGGRRALSFLHSIHPLGCGVW
jgi:hypothetical protein